MTRVYTFDIYRKLKRTPAIIISCNSKRTFYDRLQRFLKLEEMDPYIKVFYDSKDMQIFIVNMRQFFSLRKLKIL